jgi:steroid 5-alpha reductase family enzyme
MDPYHSSAIAVATLFFVVWLLSVALRDASVVDLIWGAGFAVLAWVAWFGAPDANPARLVLPILSSLWGLRLSLYLTYRNWGQGEDPRYVAIRARNQPFWLKSLWIVFGLQAGLQWIISLPLLSVQRGPLAEGSWSLAALGLGALLFGAGLLCESLADFQLARFKADPANAGQVLDRGLWRYTRHPNYFGDFLVWWGLFAVALGQGAPLWTVISPLIMSGLLLKVSGVPLLESRMRETRPAYSGYVERTPAFFPGRPRPA